ncbi:hypothetical protein QOZ80_4BG0344890 [Eleusine coracana subsp. coracana]|nr:hypothetical protein QOZ80_4BG0344890 [Eleusine coracana subsp. coracana]
MPGLHGPIPDSFGNLSRLSIFNIMVTNVSGSLPASLSRTNLTSVSFFRNKLTGRIPGSCAQASIEEKTIVWYIDGSIAISSGSSLEFALNGNLSLRDSTGAEIWSPQIAGGAYACMNDNGNFAVYGADGSPKWQSFTTPADTILPYQELSSGTILHSKLMDTDYSNGRFILNLETNGNLTFYTVAVPSGFKYDAYWSTNTSGKSSKLVYDANGTIYYALEHTSTVIMSAVTGSINQFYHWAKLDPDGVLRQYKYPKKGTVSSGTERLLVYPFMPNGSLNKFLFGKKQSWNLRLAIAQGVARGLLYLHEECGKQIIHCDIKAENILLDENFITKISDFGLAKLLKAEQTQTSTGIRGTRGYFAPEWFKNVGISSKVDVYSFGIVILEIICCRRNVDLKAADEDKVLLTYWAYDCYRCGRLDLLVEGDEEAIVNMKMVERLTAVALWCIQDEPGMRPTMLKVTKMLDGAIEIPQPPVDTPTYISSL